MIYALLLAGLSCNVAFAFQTLLEQAAGGDAAAQNSVGCRYYYGRDSVEQDYGLALQWWEKAAGQGHAAAVGNLGMCYRYGHGAERDSVKAVQLYLESMKAGNDSLFVATLDAAKSGTVFDEVVMALCYQKGNGVKRNNRKAAEYFEAAAGQQSADACRELALLCLNTGKKEDAAKWFLQSAGQGDLPSVYYSGLLRMDGIGTERDTVAALGYLREAAERGFPQALFDLSGRYEKGDGVARDTAAALGYLREAAAKGSSRAQWEYACRLRDGKGVERDFHFAASWMALSVASGNNYAFQRIYCNPSKPDTTLFAGYLRCVAHIDGGAFDMALEDSGRLSDAGLPEGLTMRGIALSGKYFAGEQRDSALLEEAVRCLWEAASADHLAKYTLYRIAQKHDIVSGKPDELLKSAARGGFYPALWLLGKAYFDGTDTIGQDYGKAVECFRKADAMGLLGAEYARLYAECLEQGLGGLEPDADAARAVVKRALPERFMDKLVGMVSSACGG